MKIPNLSTKCKHCGCTFGSHRATDNRCPANERQLDFDEGPGTTFEPVNRKEDKMTT